MHDFASGGKIRCQRQTEWIVHFLQCVIINAFPCPASLYRLATRSLSWSTCFKLLLSHSQGDSWQQTNDVGVFAATKATGSRKGASLRGNFTHNSPYSMWRSATLHFWQRFFFFLQRLTESKYHSKILKRYKALVQVWNKQESTSGGFMLWFHQPDLYYQLWATQDASIPTNNVYKKSKWYIKMFLKLLIGWKSKKNNSCFLQIHYISNDPVIHFKASHPE